MITTKRREPRLRPIRTQLIKLVLVALGLSLGLSVIASVWRETMSYAESRRTELTATAHIFASQVADPIALGNRTDTNRVLRSIARLPHVGFIGVTDPSGRPLAELGAAVTTITSDAGAGIATPIDLLLGNDIIVQVPVIRGGVTIGTLTLFAAPTDLRDRLVSSLSTLVASTLLAGVFGLLVAFRMQRRITQPIQHLTAAMDEVRRSQSFERFVSRQSNDETGLMVDTFNEMMAEIRARDARIARYTVHLEREVDDRTADLKVAKDIAERASQAKSDFLSTMSHEIRTPMNGMMVMAELLAASSLDGRARRYANVIAKSGQSLLAIINDILDFSKIESGKLDLEAVEFDPAEQVEDVVNLFHERARAKSLALVAHVGATVPARIKGDPVRFTQIVSNLVNNAIKFTATGHVRVSIERVDAGRDTALVTTLRIAVADTGIGIAADKLNGIFDPFTQAEQSTTRRFGGTGLGLAIVRKLAEAMGGSVAVSSRVGHGSTFAFTVRAAIVEGMPKPVAPTRTRIIMALDGGIVAETLGSQIRDVGLTPITVNPGRLSVVPIADHDVVLADSETLRLYAVGLRDRPSRPGLVALADFHDVDVDRLVDERVIDAVLTAPVQRRALRDLAEIITEGTLQGSARTPRRGGATETGLIPTFQGARVLVVDDSAVNREVIVEALSRLGVEAMTASDGRTAFETVLNGRFDLVFMDCSMPGMDGFEATRRIRRAEVEHADRRTPIVALTAHVAGVTETEWRSAGMDDYVVKPFTLATLARALAALLTPTGKTSLSVPLAPEPAAAPDPSAVSAEADAAPHDWMPILDETILANLRSIDTGTGLLGRVVGLYRTHAPEALERIAAAIGANEPAAIAEAAHALKSMSLNVGAARVAAACAALEQMAEAGTDAGFAALIDDIRSAVTAVLPLLAAQSEPDAADPAPSVQRPRSDLMRA